MPSTRSPTSRIRPAASVFGSATISVPGGFRVATGRIPTHTNLFGRARFISRASTSPIMSCSAAVGRCARRSARTGSGPTTTTTAREHRRLRRRRRQSSRQRDVQAASANDRVCDCRQQPAAGRRRIRHGRERGSGARAVSLAAAGVATISRGVARLSTAWFRLRRPFATLDPADNVFRISGDQLNYGIEAMVTGRVGTRLVTYGGFTVLDPVLTTRPLPRPTTSTSSAFRPGSRTC